MREVKFQVFVKDWEGVEKCFDGYFLHLLDDGRYRIAFTNSDSDKEFVTVDMDKIRFFTGLHDKNGTPIYEGDILKVPCLYETPENTSTTYHNEKVFFEKGSYRTDYGTLDDDGWDYFSNECEVIGNQFENPELLEQTT